MATFISKDYLFLNISVALRRGSFSISLSKQKRVVTVENMIELPERNTRVVSVLEQCTHYHFLSG